MSTKRSYILKKPAAKSIKNLFWSLKLTNMAQPTLQCKVFSKSTVVSRICSKMMIIVQSTLICFLYCKVEIWDTWWQWIVSVKWLTDKSALSLTFPGLELKILIITNDAPRAGFKSAQNLTSDFDGWGCTVLMISKPNSFGVSYY